jgi:hypothetical protein
MFYSSSIPYGFIYPVSAYTYFTYLLNSFNSSFCIAFTIYKVLTPFSYCLRQMASANTSQISKFLKGNITTGKGKGEKERKLWGREGERRAEGNRLEITDGERDTGSLKSFVCKSTQLR